MLPWLLPEASAELTDLLEMKNKNTAFVLNSHTIQACINSYHSYIQIYTGASKSLVNKRGVAFIVPEISDEVAAYTGEMLAILLAV